jgi:TP901 family phage tail tape measure protein
MSKFVLTAQLRLQAPRNVRQVVNQIQSQLAGVSVPINVDGASKAQRQLKNVTREANNAAGAARNMGKSFGLALRRFAAFTIASRAVSLLSNNLAGAVAESIEFQREVVKIAQVTGKSIKQLRGLTQEVSNLSVTLGVSSKELISVGRILAQTGLKANDLQTALRALAKTTLAPTFEDIRKTAEGAVAILAQFEQGVGSLERQLGAINAVAGQFAVESGDLIGAIRRTGGVFKAAGGSLEEFLGLFTSVRATTRESSESIATGLRTIFTRIQRPSTIQFLREMGVELTTADGKFVGAYEAVRRLSKALADMPAGDLRFIRIAEQLGGFRQIGKVIPLLQQFEVAEKARQAAIAGGNSLTKDAATAQQALAVQIARVREEFLALIRGITDTTSFQVMVKTTLNLASALIKVADALKPMLPLMAAFAAFKITTGLGGIAAGVGAGLRGKHSGGRVQTLARGGLVPGTGNRDTVPAMLQPGEFVIRKSSVQKLGAGQLQAMNQNKRMKGGPITGRFKDVAESQMYVEDTGDPYAVSKSSGDPFLKRKSVKRARNKFTLGDNFKYTLKPHKVNVYDGTLSDKDLQEYKASVKSGDASRRGFAFEKLVEKKYANVKLSTPGSRMDAMYSNAPAEIKSLERELTQGALNKKVVGAGLSPRGEPSSKYFQRKLTGKGLDPKDDTVDFGSVHLFEDASRLKRGEQKKAQRLARARKSAFGGFARYGSGTAKRGVSQKDSAIAALQKEHGLTLNEAQRVHKNPALLGSVIKKKAGPQREGRTLSTGNVGGLFLDVGTDKTGPIKKTFPKGSLTGKGFSRVEQIKASVPTYLLDKKASAAFNNALEPAIETAIGTLSTNVADSFSNLGLPTSPTQVSKTALQKIDQRSIAGHLFEGVTSSLSGATLSESGATFDFVNPSRVARGKLKQLFGQQVSDKYLESKATLNRDSMSEGANSIQNKILSAINSNMLKDKDFSKYKFASGGIAPSDIVPALLTPGEFVVNKKSAQSIGYSSLNRMNKKGVSGFAAGGPVGVKKFQTGGVAGGGMDPMVMMMAITAMTSVMSSVADESTKMGQAIGDISSAISSGMIQLLVFFQMMKMGKDNLDKFAHGVDQAADSAEGAADGGAAGGGAAGGGAESAGTRRTEAEAREEEERSTATTRESTRTTKEERITREERADREAKEAALRPEKEKLAKREEIAASREEDVAGKKSDRRDKNDAAIDASFEELQAREASEQADKTRSEKVSDQDKAIDTERDGAQHLANVEAETQRQASDLEGAKRVEEQAGMDRGTAEREKQNLSSRRTDKIAEQEELQRREQAKRDEGADVQADFVEAETKEVQLKREIDQKTAQREAAEADRGVVGVGPGAESGPDTDEMKKLDKQLEKLNKQREENAKTIDNLDGKMQQLGSEHDELGEQYGRNEAELQELEDQLTSAGDKVSQLKTAENDAADATADRTRELAATQNAEEQAADNHKTATSNRVAADKAADDALEDATTAATKHGKAIEEEAQAMEGLDKSRKKEKVALRKQRMSQQRLAAQQSKVAAIASRAAKSFRKMGNVFQRTMNKMSRGVQKLASRFSKVGKVISSLAAVGAATMIALEKILEVAEKRNERAQKEAMEAGNRADMESTVDRGQTLGVASSIVGGVGQGAMMGAMVAGPWGALIGGVTGAIVTGFLAIQGSDERRKEAAEKKATLNTQISTKNQDKVLKRFTEDQKKGTGDFRGSTGRMMMTAQVGAESRAAMKRIEAKDVGEEKREELKGELAKRERDAAMQLGKTATSAAEVEAGLRGMGDGLSLTKEELAKLAKSTFAMAEAQRRVAKANLDTLKIMSTFGAAGLAVNNLLASFETGAVALDSTIATIEAAQQNMGMEAEGARALEAARAEVLGVVGGGGTAVGAAVNRSFSRARDANSFMGSVQSRVSTLDLSQASPEEAREQLRTALTAGLAGSSDIKQAIEAALADPDFNPQGDITAIIKHIQKGLSPLQKAALESAKAIAKHTHTMVKLTQQRRQAELQYIQVQKQAIDIQIQAAKMFQEFGGAKLTSGQQVGARVAQFNLSAKDVGVTGLSTGSAVDINRVSEQISQKFTLQQNKANAAARTGGMAFGGVRGVDEDRRKQLQAANKSLMEFTKQRIGLLKEELAIVKKKNEAEKSALDRLLGGDIEGFIKGQAAAGAGAALRTGDAGLAGLFGAGALGAGFKTLEGQGLSPAEMERAGRMALSGVGVTDQRSAQILAGSTAEEDAMKSQGRALAQSLGDQAQHMVEMERMNVNAQEVRIQAANVLFEKTMDEKVRGQDFAEGIARGGLIHASRGIFVPRGTDTVPAMLTPGEFVINRSAVNRGNNLQILKAMNSGSAVNASAPGMAGGGQVGYYAGGGVAGLFSRFTQGVTDVGNAMVNPVETFRDAVEKLKDFKLNVKLDPTHVTVHLDAGVLGNLTTELKDQIYSKIVKDLPPLLKQDAAGDFETGSSTLPKIG